MRRMTTRLLPWGTLALVLASAFPCAASEGAEPPGPSRDAPVARLCRYSLDGCRLILSRSGASPLRYSATAPLPYEPPQPGRGALSPPAPGGLAPTPPKSYRSPRTAAGLAVGFSFGSLVLGGLLTSEGRAEGILTGYIVASLGIGIGASAGHFYAGETGRGVLTAVFRVFGFGVGGVMLISAWAGRASEYPRMSAGDAQLQAAEGLALVAASLGLAIYDMVDAPRAARRTNARLGLANVSLAPLLTTRGPAPSGGLAVQANF
jgi:hypothetical protein